MSRAISRIFQCLIFKHGNYHHNCYSIGSKRSSPASLLYHCQEYSTSAIRSTVVSKELTDNKDKTYEYEFDLIEQRMEWTQGVSRGKALIDSMVEYLSRNPKLTHKVSFESMKSRTEKVDHFFKRQTFGAHLLNACLITDNLALGKRYYDEEKSHSLSAMANYIRLLARRKGPTKNFEADILSIYEQIQKKNNNTWDLNTGEKVVEAIILTKKWRDAFKIVEEMKIGGPIPGAVYADLATASFNNKDFDTGWSLLQGDGKQRFTITPFVAWLRNCPVKNEENMKRLLDYLDENNIYVTGELVEEVKFYFKNELRYNVFETKINFHNSSCKRCKGKLEQNQLTPNEFEELQKLFLDRVVKDQDVFLNTNPKELQRYIEFINKSSAFDFIVDGLNVGLSHKMGKKLSKGPGQILFSAVKQLKDRRSNILVIGRKHMVTWSEWSHIKQSAETFLIEDMSKDDPFILYATMKSGIHAKFISRDLMHSHSFRLQDTKFERMFKRWRLSAQLSPFFGPQGVFRLKPFSDILPVPQKNNNCWHIPYDNELLISPYAIPDNWLCFEPVK